SGEGDQGCKPIVAGETLLHQPDFAFLISSFRRKFRNKEADEERCRCKRDPHSQQMHRELSRLGVLAKCRDIPRNRKQHSERKSQENAEAPGPEFSQYHRGESDLNKIQQAERIRWSAAERQDKRQTQRVHAEQYADQVFRASSKTIRLQAE